MGPPGAQRKSVPQTGPPARRPPVAGRTEVADRRLPLHDPGFSPDAQRRLPRRPGRPQQARRTARSARLDVVQPALGLVAQSRLRCRRPDQLVCAVHQSRPHLADRCAGSQLRRRPRTARPDRRFRHHPGPASERPDLVEGSQSRCTGGAFLLDQEFSGTLCIVADGIADRRPDAAGLAVQRAVSADAWRPGPRPQPHQVGGHRQPRAGDAERQIEDGRRHAGRQQEAARLDGGGRCYRHRRQPGQSVPPVGDIHRTQQIGRRPRSRQCDLARARLPVERRRLHASAGSPRQPADDADREIPQGSRQDAPRHAQPWPTPSIWRR